MRNTVIVATLLVVCCLIAAPTEAVTVTLQFRYAGLPVSSTFTSLGSGFVEVGEEGVSSHKLYRSIAVADSFQIPDDIKAGKVTFWVIFTPNATWTSSLHFSGDLYARLYNVTVPDQATYQLVVDMFQCVRLTQPLDSSVQWPGTTTCPAGPAEPQSFLVAWDPVPRAVSYAIRLWRKDCSNNFLETTTTPVSETSALITQQTVVGERQIEIEVIGYDGTSTQLTTTPYMEYENAYVAAFYFHLQPTARTSHSPGQHLSQLAHIPGSGSSYWKSDLTLTNPFHVPLTTKLYYTPRDKNGLAEYQETEVTMPPVTCRTYQDVVDTLFHASGGGSLEVVSTSLLASLRTYTPASGGGYFGQGIMPVTATQVIMRPAPSKAVAGGVVKGSGARTNLAINEVWGEAAKVTVELLDRDGTVKGSRSYDLLPYGNIQVNDLAQTLASLTTMTEGIVRVTVTEGNGRVGATMSVVDGSGDPSTVPLLVY